MRTFVLTLISASAVALGAVSTAGSGISEGVHGAGISIVTPEFGSPGVIGLVINANRRPPGDPVGNVLYTRVGFGQAGVQVWARPVFLQTSPDAACVVAKVERWRGPGQTSHLVFHVEDFPGGRDLFQVVHGFPGDPSEQCAIIGPGPDPLQLTYGNFWVSHP